MADGGVYVNSNGDWVRAGGAGGSGGGIDVESEREHQLLQGDGAKGWKPGMALEVVDAVPADDDAGYAIGDVVFVTGPGSGGSPLPGVGGGKVLQVVHAQQPLAKQETNLTDYQKITDLELTMTNVQPGSKIFLFASVLIVSVGTGNDQNRSSLRIADTDGNPIPGAVSVDVGTYKYSTVSGSSVDNHVSLLGMDENPGTGKSYQVEFKTIVDGKAEIRNNANPALFYAMEVAA